MAKRNGDRHILGKCPGCQTFNDAVFPGGRGQLLTCCRCGATIHAELGTCRGKEVVKIRGLTPREWLTLKRDAPAAYRIIQEAVANAPHKAVVRASRHKFIHEMGETEAVE